MRGLTDGFVVFDCVQNVVKFCGRTVVEHRAAVNRSNFIEPAIGNLLRYVLQSWTQSEYWNTRLLKFPDQHVPLCPSAGLEIDVISPETDVIDYKQPPLAVCLKASCMLIFIFRDHIHVYPTLCSIFTCAPQAARSCGHRRVSVCLSVRTLFVRKISQEPVHGSPPNLVGGSRG